MQNMGGGSRSGQGLSCLVQRVEGTIEFRHGTEILEGYIKGKR